MVRLLGRWRSLLHSKARPTLMLLTYLESPEKPLPYGEEVPHQATFVPGGITEFPDVKKFANFTYRVLEVKRWIDDYMIPLMDKFYDSYKDELTNSGETQANLLSFGVFDDETLNPQNRLLKPGAIINGSLTAENLYDEIAPKIFEHVTHSWYAEGSAGNPTQTVVPIPQYSGINKQGKYSWCKAPRWDDKVVEVGPIARMWSTALQKGGKIETDAGSWSPPKKPDTIERLYARAYEVAFVATNLVGTMYKLLDLINRGEREVFQPFTVPDNSEGYGLTEAARGALGHWIKVEDKKIARYQVITPTTWNGSPRDDKGRRGPIEEALANTTVKNDNPTLDAVRVVRAFDPCIACAVHVFDGSKISTRISKSTEIQSEQENSSSDHIMLNWTHVFDFSRSVLPMITLAVFIIGVMLRLTKWFSFGFGPHVKPKKPKPKSNRLIALIKAWSIRNDPSMGSVWQTRVGRRYSRDNNAFHMHTHTDQRITFSLS